jgi:hypothetical protein
MRSLMAQAGLVSSSASALTSTSLSWVAEKSLSRVVRMLKRRESDGSNVNCSSGEMASRVAERIPNLSLLRYL